MKRRANGYGRSFADIYVVVKKPYEKLMIDEGWVVIFHAHETTTFRYSCINRYQGDDETVVDCLMRDMLNGIGDTEYEIDWAKSVC